MCNTHYIIIMFCAYPLSKCSVITLTLHMKILFVEQCMCIVVKGITVCCNYFAGFWQHQLLHCMSMEEGVWSSLSTAWWPIISPSTVCLKLRWPIGRTCWTLSPIFSVLCVNIERKNRKSVNLCFKTSPCHLLMTFCQNESLNVEGLAALFIRCLCFWFQNHFQLISHPSSRFDHFSNILRLKA